MIPSPLTSGLIAVFLSLILLSGLLNEPVSLAVGSGIGTIIFCLCILHITSVGRLIQGADCSRVFDKKIIRQGRRAEVKTTLSFQIPMGMTARYHEKCPLFCSVERGKIWTVLKPGQKTVNLSYSIIPLFHGKIIFEGGYLTVADRFFSSEIQIKKGNFSGPEQQVQPSPLFSKSLSGGSRELERFGPVKGFSVRHYREYLPGDDLRYVDWKLSARRGELYIREYVSTSEAKPLLIIDLPDKNQEYNSDAFSRLVSHVSGHIETLLGKKEPLILLLVSGITITDALYEGRDLTRCMEIIRTRMHPVVRSQYLYRYNNSVTIRSGNRNLKNFQKNVADNRVSHSISRIIQIKTENLVYSGSTTFSSRMDMIIGKRHLHEIFFYSLCDGDISHIYETAALARQTRVPFRIRTPIQTETCSRAIHLARGELIEVF